MPLSESCTRQHPAVPTWQVQVTSHIAARANRNPTYATYATPLKCSVSVNTQYGYAVCQLCSNQEPAQSIIAQSQGSCFPKLHQHPDCASSQAAGDDAGKPCKDVAPHIIRVQTR